jgi:hypothetical protein
MELGPTTAAAVRSVHPGVPRSARHRRGHVPLVHNAERVTHDIDSGHGEHDFNLVGDGLRMRLRVVVDAGREFVHVLSERGCLRVVPRLGRSGIALMANQRSRAA